MLSIFLSILLLIAGLCILLVGAEFLIKGASSISKKAGIPPIVIGLTIVAFGTSAPELLVNIFSALNGTTDLALGNVIGSNIANILLILGISALIIPLEVKKNTTWKEIPFAILAILAVYFLANDVLFDGSSINVIGRIDGLILLSFFTIFMYYTVELTRKGRLRNLLTTEEKVKTYSNGIAALMTLVGLVALFLGGQLLVTQAIKLAQMAGLSEMFIGLTIVSVGTSLPELATSVLAARRGHADIAIGNVVGSNIFNIFWILGLTSTITSIPISPEANFDIIIALFVTTGLFGAVFIGQKQKIDRWQGGLFLFTYVLYTIFLVFQV